MSERQYLEMTLIELNMEFLKYHRMMPGAFVQDFTSADAPSLRDSPIEISLENQRYWGEVFDNIRGFLVGGNTDNLSELHRRREAFIVDSAIESARKLERQNTMYAHILKNRFEEMASFIKGTSFLVEDLRHEVDGWIYNGVLERYKHEEADYYIFAVGRGGIFDEQEVVFIEEKLFQMHQENLNTFLQDANAAKMLRELGVDILEAPEVLRGKARLDSWKEAFLARYGRLPRITETK